MAGESSGWVMRVRRERNRRGQQPSLWDELIPGYTLEDDPELKRIDALLDDDAFMEPFRRRLTSRIGRPTIPLDVYLRMMYLRQRHQLSYEEVVREVADSLRWRKFCHLGLEERLPERSTLIKLTNRLGADLLQELHGALMEVGRREKILRGRKARVDATVTTADIHHPSDTSLLADGVRAATRMIRRLQKQAGDDKPPLPDRGRSVHKAVGMLRRVSKARDGELPRLQERAARALVGISAEVVKAGREILGRLREQSEALGGQVVTLRRQGREMLDRLEQVREQTLSVLRGASSIPERVVSLFDPDARPIRRGKAGRSTEFGYKVLLVESEQRVITHYRVMRGAPGDTTLLEDAVQAHIQGMGRVPKSVATDRGFHSAANENWLRERGVQQVSLPQRGGKSQDRTLWEKRSWFVRLQRWRAGQEASISELSRVFGLSRSRSRGLERVRIHDGWAIMAYNLRRMSKIARPAAV